MATRRKQNERVITPPTIAPASGIELLRRQIEKGEKLLTNRPIKEIDHQTWKNVTREYLEKCFGSESPNISQFIDFTRIYMSSADLDEVYWENFYAEGLSNQLAFLKSMIELLETAIEISPPSSSSPPIQKTGIPFNRSIFVVHGHNEQIKEATARFLERLQLKPVILHEQPNLGRTIIEKFTDHSDVGFAVVLLTADDSGGAKGVPFEKQMKRARQNVILELGFFLGKVGRKNVCALYEEGVEIPSDYYGVLFVKLDDRGAWKIDLAKEIKAAGIEIDMNLVFAN